jgi:hypothetical protein
MLRIVKTNRSGELIRPEQKAFGGTFPFFEKLKMGGTGSSKMIYHKGIPEFDLLNKGEVGMTSFVSFELLKNGLLLRLNRNQKTKCLGIQLTHIKVIKLLAYRIEIREKRFSIHKTKIIHRGELTIESKDGGLAEFEILSSNFESIKKYFECPPLNPIFNYAISTNPPQKDIGYLIQYLDLFT